EDDGEGEENEDADENEGEVGGERIADPCAQLGEQVGSAGRQQRNRDRQAEKVGETTRAGIFRPGWRGVAVVGNFVPHSARAGLCRWRSRGRVGRGGFRRALFEKALDLPGG